jgi:hypothetical protein
VPEQKGEGVVDGLGFNEVVIIKDKDNPIGQGGNLVDQGSQDSLGRWRLRGFECAQRAFSDVGFNGLQGRDQVSQKADQVVVALVKREPGDGCGRWRSAHCLDPFTDQRRLAKAGRDGDESELAA